MERIQSFEVDHDFIVPDVYISRIDGDITTYDLRTRKPNTGDVMDNATMHTFEHLFATYARNSELGDKVIYVGPMGCCTGFYFLTRDTMTSEESIALVRESMAFVRDFEGEIPGNKKEECGNYLYHDLAGAKAIGAEMYQVLKDWQPKDLQYKE